MVLSVGVLVFHGVEELDFVGPWEVFAMAGTISGGVKVNAIAQQPGIIGCSKGLRVLPDHTFADSPSIDVLVVPGGWGTRREADNPVLLEWIRNVGASCRWVFSVCTGILLLCEAGLANGKRVTSHRSFLDTLQERGDVIVVEGVRYVVDGNLLSAAGISAGVDAALWLVGEVLGKGIALQTQKRMEYYPDPPYQDHKGSEEDG